MQIAKETPSLQVQHDFQTFRLQLSVNGNRRQEAVGHHSQECSGLISIATHVDLLNSVWNLLLL